MPGTRANRERKNMYHGDKDRWVTVSDETSDPQTFLGLRINKSGAPDAGSDVEIPVFVYFDGRANGFGDTVPVVKQLKHLGDGKYGA